MSGTRRPITERWRRDNRCSMLTFVVIGDVVVCRICELLSMSTVSSTSLLDECIVLFLCGSRESEKTCVLRRDIILSFSVLRLLFHVTNCLKICFFPGAQGSSILASTLSFSFWLPSIPKLCRASLGSSSLILRKTNAIINKRKLCKNRSMSYCRLTGSFQRIRITRR